MSARLRIHRLALLCSIAAAAFAVGLTSARAQQVQVAVDGIAAQRFDNEADQLYVLEIAGDAASKLELARVLMRGRQTSPTNPLPVSELDRAEGLIREVVAGPDVALSHRAQALLADLLRRRGTPSAIAEGDEISAQLVLAGYAPAVTDLVLSGAALPEGFDRAAAIASLETEVLDGNAFAALALSKITATDDPPRSAALAEQAIVLLMVAAPGNVRAATELGRRLLVGDGVAKDVNAGLRLLRQGASQGSNDAVVLLADMFTAGEVGLDAAAVRDAISAGLAAGSTKAADLIASDLSERPVFGFAREDSIYALSLLGEAGDRDALLHSAQMYASGSDSAPDLVAAVPIIEKLVDVEGKSQDEIMRLALKLDATKLPIPLALKYVEPLFRMITGPDMDEANFHANRLLAAAAEAGIEGAVRLPFEKVTEIVGQLRGAGERGNARSLILLGDLYYAGVWVDINYRQAMQYYEQALALEPDQVARERVAKALMQFKSTPFEQQRFTTLITQLSDEGSPWAQYRKGILMIEGGPGIPPDVAAGEDLLLKLSAEGFVPAIKVMVARLRDVQDNERIDAAIEAFSAAWNLRRDYRTGKQLGEFYVIAGRPAQARAVLDQPMYASDPEALFALARVEIDGATPNEATAFELASRALSVAGDAPVRIDIARFLAGLILPAARAEAEAELKRLADAGDPDAQVLLVTSYLPRLAAERQLLPSVLSLCQSLAKVDEVAPIIELAMTYLAKGADKEIAAQVLPVAEAALADLSPDSYLATLVAQAYYLGYGTEPDVERGNAVVEAAAAAGSRDALAELGLQYFYGMGREREPDIGIALLDSAAALGHGVARVELGRLYSSATGPSVDRVKAYSLFLEAANNGSSAGMLEVGRLYLAGWGIGEDEAQGVSWFERAASLGNLDALYQLYFHYHSRPDAESQALARSWLDKAVDAGINPARLRLAVHLLSTQGDAPGTSGYDDAIDLLDDAFASGYNTARKFRQTTTVFDLPLQGEARGVVQ